jgi:hypothetical protein
MTKDQFDEIVLLVAEHAAEGSPDIAYQIAHHQIKQLLLNEALHNEAYTRHQFYHASYLAVHYNVHLAWVFGLGSWAFIYAPPNPAEEYYMNAQEARNVIEDLEFDLTYWPDTFAWHGGQKNQVDFQSEFSLIQEFEPFLPFRNSTVMTSSSTYFATELQLFGHFANSRIPQNHSYEPLSEEEEIQALGNLFTGVS